MSGAETGKIKTILSDDADQVKWTEVRYKRKNTRFSNEDWKRLFKECVRMDLLFICESQEKKQFRQKRYAVCKCGKIIKIFLPKPGLEETCAMESEGDESRLHRKCVGMDNATRFDGTWSFGARKDNYKMSRILKQFEAKMWYDLGKPW